MAAIVVTKEEFESNVGELLEKARNGECIQVNFNGTVQQSFALELKPIEKPEKKLVLGLLKGQMIMHDGFDDYIEDVEAFLRGEL